jgi:glycosyltransferase involved in cell wall biosynthesis
MSSGRSVLIIGNHPPPFGGVPTHIRYLATYLVERGWKVNIVTISSLKGWASLSCTREAGGYHVYRPSKQTKWTRAFGSRLGWSILSRAGRSFFRNPKSFMSQAGFLNFLLGIIRRENVEVICAYHLMNALWGAYLAEGLKLPMVTTIFGEIFSHRKSYEARRREVDFVCSMSRKILSCSNHCAASLKLLGPTVPVETVYYGIDVGHFTPARDGASIRARLGIPAESQVVLFVGRMIRDMGLHVFLDAVRSLIAKGSRAVFVIAGKPGELTEQAMAMQAGFPGKVFALSDVSMEDLPLVYASATVVAIPSVNERACLGLAIIEAMATAKPVVVSDAGGGPEVVTHMRDGMLVPAGDAGKLAEAIGNLLGDPQKMESMGRLGRQKAEAVFDARQANRTMERILLEALEIR